ncbi:hypothetical protein [Actinophytocola glycyrrhizae]|uniref:DUF3180 family protein n=1 Tax=Actinophytocola glycyrrhizae TaxID=2044873 RepID=A0ABV9S7R7_9PSEU
MPNQRRWSFVPRTQGGCVLLLLVGILAVAYNSWQMAEANDVAVLPVIAVVLGVVVIATAVAGLVSPRLRSR